MSWALLRGKQHVLSCRQLILAYKTLTNPRVMRWTHQSNQGNHLVHHLYPPRPSISCTCLNPHRNATLSLRSTTACLLPTYTPDTTLAILSLTPSSLCGLSTFVTVYLPSCVLIGHSTPGGIPATKASQSFQSASQTEGTCMRKLYFSSYLRDEAAPSLAEGMGSIWRV